MVSFNNQIPFLLNHWGPVVYLVKKEFKKCWVMSTIISIMIECRMMFNKLLKMIVVLYVRILTKVITINVSVRAQVYLHHNVSS